MNYKTICEQLNVMHYARRTLCGLALLAFSGCGEPTEPVQQGKARREITDFKTLYLTTSDNSLANGPADPVTSIYAADLDKDGDLDVIVGTASGRVHFLENKIPSKPAEYQK